MLWPVWVVYVTVAEVQVLPPGDAVNVGAGKALTVITAFDVFTVPQLPLVTAQ